MDHGLYRIQRKDTYGHLIGWNIYRDAAGAGFEAATQALEGGTLIIGFIMSNCTAGLITMAFLTMNPVIIIAVVAIYFVLYVLFRKNKSSCA